MLASIVVPSESSPAKLRACFGTIFLLFIGRTPNHPMTLKKKCALFVVPFLLTRSFVGFPAASYLRFCPQLGPSLHHVVNVCLETHVVPHTFSEGCVVLVLKGDRDPTDPSSWRPIRLLSVNRKLVAALFASRIRGLLPRLVNAQQCNSVPGRNIFSALALTRDLFQ